MRLGHLASLDQQVERARVRMSGLPVWRLLPAAAGGEVVDAAEESAGCGAVGVGRASLCGGGLGVAGEGPGGGRRGRWLELVFDKGLLHVFHIPLEIFGVNRSVQVGFEIWDLAICGKVYC